MIPKINIEYLENDLYSITKSNSRQTSINYIDFNIQTQQPMPTGALSTQQYPTISPNVYVKNVQLKKLEIKIDTNFSLYDDDEMQTNRLIFETIKNNIDANAIKAMTKLGEKNRLNAPKRLSNFNIKEIRLKYKGNEFEISRNFVHKFISSCNYIATQGRIGPGQFILLNNKTYNHIYDNLDDDFVDYDKDGNIIIGNIPFFINDLVDDDIIITARKNLLDQPGIHCAILTDNDGNIHFDEVSSFASMEKTLIMYYDVFDVGLTPEHQYLNVNTRTLAYYRNRKLMKIKELYGNS